MEWRSQTPLNKMKMTILPQEKVNTLGIDCHRFESESKLSLSLSLSQLTKWHHCVFKVFGIDVSRI